MSDVNECGETRSAPPKRRKRVTRHVISRGRIRISPRPILSALSLSGKKQLTLPMLFNSRNLCVSRR